MPLPQRGVLEASKSVTPLCLSILHHPLIGEGPSTAKHDAHNFGVLESFTGAIFLANLRPLNFKQDAPAAVL